MRVRTCDSHSGNRIFVMTCFGGVSLRFVLPDLGGLAAILAVLSGIHFGVPSAYELLAFDHTKVHGTRSSRRPTSTTCSIPWRNASLDAKSARSTRHTVSTEALSQKEVDSVDQQYSAPKGFNR